MTANTDGDTYERGRDRSCERCGDDYSVELCVVGRPGLDAAVDTDRLEAYLCYSCRQETPHERLYSTDGGRSLHKDRDCPEVDDD